MVAAYQSPWGWNRRSCAASQAGPVHRKEASGLWRRGGAFSLPLLPRGRPLPLLVGGGGGGGVMEGDRLVRG